MWRGLVRYGQARRGSVWHGKGGASPFSGCLRINKARSSVDWWGMVWPGEARHGLAWGEQSPSRVVRGLTWCGEARYGAVWLSKVRSGKVRLGEGRIIPPSKFCLGIYVEQKRR